MIKVYVADNESGPAITNIKGIKSGWQWLYNEASKGLCYRTDGTLTLDFTSTDLPKTLIQRIVLVQ